ncbi:MAG: GNAT family N-acetyltransferase [Deltaproteobacteria bacterium]|jgi:N-acetylglutamate synthase-like GNAT family acetyltransferase|nr:GNAT family N-acetyltransferase [Deltaproteobacteria bacterium]MDZ4343882.1 GNAT family N-acetyltransferase [Candidatus Binatia bacterium]
MKKEIYVRSLERRDLPSIVAMEERITGVARPQYWEQRIELSEAIRPHWTSLVAEFENRFVGFLFGRAGELEFGLPGTIAWVETIGVDPAFRGRGIARELIEQFISSAEDHGIKTIFTLVTSGQTDMQTFFSRQGFAQGKMLHYQKELAS